MGRSASPRLRRVRGRCPRERGGRAPCESSIGAVFAGIASVVRRMHSVRHATPPRPPSLRRTPRPHVAAMRWRPRIERGRGRREQQRQRREQRLGLDRQRGRRRHRNEPQPRDGGPRRQRGPRPALRRGDRRGQLGRAGRRDPGRSREPRRRRHHVHGPGDAGRSPDLAVRVRRQRR